MSEVNSHISVKGHWYATVPIAIINKNVVQGLSGQMIFNMWRRV